MSDPITSKAMLLERLDALTRHHGKPGNGMIIELIADVEKSNPLVWADGAPPPEPAPRDHDAEPAVFLRSKP